MRKAKGTASSTTASLELPEAAGTAREGPSRTTIVRESASGTGSARDGARSSWNSLIEVGEDEVLGGDAGDDAVGGVDGEGNGSGNGNGKEVTDTFYSVTLAGFQESALPFITVNAGREPVTLIAYANASLFSNFVSAGLIAELGLSGGMREAAESPYLPERDLSALFGFETQVMGEIGLDILAGVRDRLVEDVRFRVFEDGKDGDGEGWWRPDLVVGMGFLNRVGGVELTEEFGGGGMGEAGVREGLGVVVQRVFEVAKRGGGEGVGGHDEL